MTGFAVAVSRACVPSPDRVGSIRRLFAVRFDGLPVWRATAGEARGFVHKVTGGHLESCPDCLANDRRMFGCETCRGSGRVRVAGDRDPYAVDKTTRYGLTPDALERRHAIDRELSRLDAQLAVALVSEADVVAHTGPFGWETARARLYAAFDLAALDAALEACAAACVVPMSGRGIVLLHLALPDPLRAPKPDPAPLVNVASKGERDRRIRRWRGEGMPVQWIAAQVGLSVSQTNRILAGQEAV